MDGRPVAAFEGESVGAAPPAAGQSRLRATAQLGEPRGAFCGIGGCFDCATAHPIEPFQLSRFGPAPAAPETSLASLALATP